MPITMTHVPYEFLDPINPKGRGPSLSFRKVKHLIMTTTVAVGSVHVWQPWLVRFHRSASYRKIICMRLIIHEILDENGILTVQQDLAWPFARMPSNLAARAYRMALIVAVGHGNLADLTPQNSTNVIKLQLRRAAAATSALN